MPEGPEIRRAADRVARALEGRRAERVWCAFDRLRPRAARLAGRVVRRVEARGKALLLHFSGGTSIYSHNQLYGRWLVLARGRREPATSRQLRLAVANGTHRALLYSASEIDILPTARLGAHAYLARLGPDALDSDPESFGRRLRDPRFAGRQLAALLLDQSFAAGLGNYLRSEILFAARLHPRRRPRDLEPGERTRLARAITRITRRAYRSGGVTNGPALAARLKTEGLPRTAWRWAVFGRPGQPCHDCGTGIRRVEMGRRLYLCPRCQEP